MNQVYNRTTEIVGHSANAENQQWPVTVPNIISVGIVFKDRPQYDGADEMSPDIDSLVMKLEEAAEIVPPRLIDRPVSRQNSRLVQNHGDVRCFCCRRETSDIAHSGLDTKRLDSSAGLISNIL